MRAEPTADPGCALDVAVRAGARAVSERSVASPSTLLLFATGVGLLPEDAGEPQSEEGGATDLEDVAAIEHVESSLYFLASSISGPVPGPESVRRIHRT